MPPGSDDSARPTSFGSIKKTAAPACPATAPPRMSSRPGTVSSRDHTASHNATSAARAMNAGPAQHACGCLARNETQHGEQHQTRKRTRHYPAHTARFGPTPQVVDSRAAMLPTIQ
ncbi:hypothetical protein ABIB35_000943 [Arthrobacter sp. UYP6]